ncbi:MAG: hypothetical protein GDYSWBUE_000431 [Candidatus Fervidibacterota bacterium]
MAAAQVLSVEELKEKARVIRKHIIVMTTLAGSGHPTTALSMVEVLVALYFGGILRYDPTNPHWEDRDRFILSKGHGCPALYAVLAEAGYFPVEQLKTLRQLGSPLEGHPNMRALPGIEASTGSLGQGLSIGLGHALAARLDGRDYHVFVMVGDGECDEGQVWEAAMAAKHFKVDNLTCIVDHNKYQQTGCVFDVMDYRPFADKWRAFGWHVQEIDGHDIEQVLNALKLAKGKPEKGTPTVIIAHTVKGKGVSFLEHRSDMHGRAVKIDEAKRALEELGWSWEEELG